MAELLADDLQVGVFACCSGTGAQSVARVDGQLTVTFSTGAALEMRRRAVRNGPHAQLRRARPGRGGSAARRAGSDRGGSLLPNDRAWHLRGWRYRSPGPSPRHATQQGRAAARHACGLVFGLAADQAASSAVYGMPEIAGVGLTEEQAREAHIPYVVGRCDLAETPRGVIAGRGGRLKLIVREDDRKLLGVHCIGDIASETVGVGHAVIAMGGTIELLLTLALNAPTYSTAYHDAAIDGLARLAEALGHRSHTHLAGWRWP